MKFLMFNLVVGVALVFLLFSGKVDLEEARGKSGAAFNEAVSKAEAVIPKTSAGLARAMPLVKAEIKPDKTQIPRAGREESVTVASAQVVPTPKPSSLPPEVAKRRDQILKPSSTAQDSGSFQLNVRDDRQEELQNLAEEMELLSAQMAAQ